MICDDSTILRHRMHRYQCVADDDDAVQDLFRLAGRTQVVVAPKQVKYDLNVPIDV